MSYSFFPLNSRSPRYNFPTTQPRDHMSTASVTGRPNKTSGDLKGVFIFFLSHIYRFYDIKRLSNELPVTEGLNN